MQQIKKRQIAAQAKGQEQAVDQLESKIVEQETDISNMENRNFYSLHCLQLETQLVHANMKILAIILQKMVASQVLGHREVRYQLAINHPGKKYLHRLLVICILYIFANYQSFIIVFLCFILS